MENCIGVANLCERQSQNVTKVTYGFYILFKLK
nr:MAG TPA: hypothetical protein [Caudoviricetes sp.]